MMIVSATNRAKATIVLVKKYIKQNKQRSIALAFAAIIAIGGLVAMQLSNAATFVVALEAEAGNVTGLATKSSTGTNSSGGFVKFGEGTTPTPTPPTPTPPTPTPPTGGAKASGLPWSSGVWNRENPGYVKQFIASPRGGVPLDNVMEYTHRGNQAEQINSIGGFAGNMPAGFNAARDDFVLSVTTWTGDGSYTTGDHGKQIGTAVCKIDSSPIVRLDWEMNLNDGAGGNGAMLNSSNFNAWVARFRAVSVGMKSTCPALRVDFNPNHGADQTSGCNTADNNSCTRRAFQQLKDVVDIYGIDTYDVWNSASGIINGAAELNDSYAYAIANGKKFSVPEWGIWGNMSVPQAKGDNPSYINAMMDWFNSHSSGMAYETYFSEPAGYIQSDLVGTAPNSRAAMAAKLKQYSSKY